MWHILLHNFYAVLQSSAEHFSSTLVATFGNHLLIGATNRPNGFSIGQPEFQKIENLIQTTQVANIFVNAEHALSYIIYPSVQSIISDSWGNITYCSILKNLILQ